MTTDTLTRDICATCQRRLIPEKRWAAMGADERADAGSRGLARKGKDGACHRCYQSQRLRHSRNAAERAQDEARARADRLEDVSFMAAQGESLSGAAARVGITTSGLEAWLKKNDARPLLDALRANEPRDHNNAANGTNVTHLDAGAARYGRRKASA